MNQLIWDLRASGPSTGSGRGGRRGGGGPPGYVVASGTYRVRLSLEGATSVQPFELADDPRYQLSRPAELEQVATARAIVGRVGEVNRALTAVRSIRDQARPLLSSSQAAGTSPALTRALQTLITNADSIENRLTDTQTHNGPAGSQDGINYRQGLDAQFSYLQTVVDGSYGPVIKGVKDRLADLNTQWSEWQRQIDVLVSHDVPAVNAMLTEAGMKPITAPSRSVSD